jgi:hypothetical protein
LLQNRCDLAPRAPIELVIVLVLVQVLVLVFRSMPAKGEEEKTSTITSTSTSTIGELEGGIPSIAPETLNLLQNAIDDGSNHDLSLPSRCQSGITINP